MLETVAVGAILVLVIVVGCEARLASERAQTAKERDAWASAAASEREALLRNASDERAALLSGLTQIQVTPTPAWSGADTSRLYQTEDDEIAKSNPELIENELAKRGLVDMPNT